MFAKQWKYVASGMLNETKTTIVRIIIVIAIIIIRRIIKYFNLATQRNSNTNNINHSKT